MNSNIAQQNDVNFRLLATINKVSDLLLQSFDLQNVDEVMHDILKIVGNASRADRCFIWKNYLKDNRLHFMKQIYEWVDEGKEVEAVQGSEIIEFVPYEPELYDLLSSGKSLNAIVKNMDDFNRSVLEPQEVQSILLAPIHFGDYFWGFIGLDNCHSEELWSSVEERAMLTVGFMVAIIINKHSPEA